MPCTDGIIVLDVLRSSFKLRVVNVCLLCYLLGEGLQADELHFETNSGTLTVKYTKDGLFHLSVPSLPPTDPLPGTPEEMGEILEARMSSINSSGSQTGLF